ncbi:uncharacterized protein MCYG_02362 [Microsporum canis CBS 113480]|uniref:Uncharacterized protein n=1 Tax=Arthroderma otae (strain ATCC MYA-4605 / CBS 113480) TaxID=554155 RepID=C5FJC2_ARTOC|nr:uncharacterized protein MCYG_02362 [Microsporum canis CBS 113480]EEQ29543.1 predicted protein [Microsporum canis CBS 113480]
MISQVDQISDIGFAGYISILSAIECYIPVARSNPARSHGCCRLSFQRLLEKPTLRWYIAQQPEKDDAMPTEIAPWRPTGCEDAGDSLDLGGRNHAGDEVLCTSVIDILRVYIREPIYIRYRSSRGIFTQTKGDIYVYRQATRYGQRRDSHQPAAADRP